MGKPKYGPDDPAVHVPPSEQPAQFPVPKAGEPVVPEAKKPPSAEPEVKTEVHEEEEHSTRRRPRRA